MRGRLLAAFCMTGLTFVSAPTLAGGVSASSGPSPVVRDVGGWRLGPAEGRTCYAQDDHDASSYIVSTNVEPLFGDLDSQAVDDFVLAKPCRRPVLFVDGSYGQGVGVADSFNVTIYRDRKHHPGKIVRSLIDVAYSDTCGELGCVEILLGNRLDAGHFWVSVQANMDYLRNSSFWGWWTNLEVRGTAAMWRNPEDGFGTGCTTYTDMILCLGDESGLGGDLAFTISTSTTIP